MQQRIDSVDSLRALACLLVIIHHVAETHVGIASGGAWILDLANDYNFGRIGVVAFFAISGYVIPSSLRGPRLAAAKTFAIRRFWRLYPPLWLAIGGALLVLDASPERAAFGATMLPTLFGDAYVMGHLWTLEVELAFYLAIAVLYLALGRLNLSVVAGVFACLAVWFYFDASLPLPDHWSIIAMHLAAMFWGATCRALMDSKLRPRLGLAPAQLKSVALAAATLLMLARPVKSLVNGLLYGRAEDLDFARCHIAAILLFVSWVLILRIRLPRLASLGRATYSTYLFHSIVFYSVLGALDQPWAAAARGQHLAFYVALGAILSFSLGALLYRYVELPSAALGKRLSRRSARPPVSASSAQTPSPILPAIEP